MAKLRHGWKNSGSAFRRRPTRSPTTSPTRSPATCSSSPGRSPRPATERSSPGASVTGVSVEPGAAAARLCALNILAQAKAASRQPRPHRQVQAHRLRQRDARVHRPSQGRQRRLRSHGRGARRQGPPHARRRRRLRACRWAPPSRSTPSCASSGPDAMLDRGGLPAARSRTAGCTTRGARHRSRTRRPRSRRRSPRATASNAICRPAAGGLPVVFHDDTLDRLVEGRGRVGGAHAGRAEAASLQDRGDGRILDLCRAARARRRAACRCWSRSRANGSRRIRPFSARSPASPAPTAARSRSCRSIPRCMTTLAGFAPDVPRGIVSGSYRHPRRRRWWRDKIGASRAPRLATCSNRAVRAELYRLRRESTADAR